MPVVREVAERNSVSRLQYVVPNYSLRAGRSEVEADDDVSLVRLNYLLFLFDQASLIPHFALRNGMCGGSFGGLFRIPVCYMPIRGVAFVGQPWPALRECPPRVRPQSFK